MVCPQTHSLQLNFEQLHCQLQPSGLSFLVKNITLSWQGCVPEKGLSA